MTSQGELPIRLKVPEMSFKVREKLTTAEMSLRDMGMKLGISGIAMAAQIQPTTTSGDASAGKSSRPPADIEQVNRCGIVSRRGRLMAKHSPMENSIVAGTIAHCTRDGFWAAALWMTKRKAREAQL